MLPYKAEIYFYSFDTLKKKVACLLGGGHSAQMYALCSQEVSSPLEVREGMGLREGSMESP